MFNLIREWLEARTWRRIALARPESDPQARMRRLFVASMLKASAI